MDKKLKYTSVTVVEEPPSGDLLSRFKDDKDSDLMAADIEEAARTFLAERGRLVTVNPHLLEMYAVNVTRWVQCENRISKLGFLYKSEKGGQAVKSPFIEIAAIYQKQSSAIWKQIWADSREKTTDKLERVEETDAD